MPRREDRQARRDLVAARKRAPETVEISRCDRCGEWTTSTVALDDGTRGHLAGAWNEEGFTCEGPMVAYTALRRNP